MRLSKLICGDFSIHGSVEPIFKNLDITLQKVESKIETLIQQDNTDEILMYAPYLSRKLLEVSFTALIGRMDIFRLNYLYNVQLMEGDEYLHKRSPSAINWGSDIFQKEKFNNGDMWKVNNNASNASRAIFGEYTSEMFWKTGYKKVIDDNELTNFQALSEYRSMIESPEKFMTVVRSNLSRIYSSLSKAIHGELIVQEDLIMDKPTTIDLLIETIKYTTLLGFVSHFIDTNLANLPKNEAIEIYQEIYDWSENVGV